MATLSSKPGPSSSSTTDSSIVGISMCWGHFSRALPALDAQGCKLGRPERDSAAQPCSVHEFFPVRIVGQGTGCCSARNTTGCLPRTGRACSTGNRYSRLSSVRGTSSPPFLPAAVPLSVSESGYAWPATLRFSRICVSSFIPERTTVTSGWFHIQRSAHSAGVLLIGASSQISLLAGGTVLVRFPPRRGSMMMTPSPFEAAYFRPAVPAWFFSSRKLYWIWQKSQS